MQLYILKVPFGGQPDHHIKESLVNEVLCADYYVHGNWTWTDLTAKYISKRRGAVNALVSKGGVHAKQA